MEKKTKQYDLVDDYSKVIFLRISQLFPTKTFILLNSNKNHPNTFSHINVKHSRRPTQHLTWIVNYQSQQNIKKYSKIRIKNTSNVCLTIRTKCLILKESFHHLNIETKAITKLIVFIQVFPVSIRAKSRKQQLIVSNLF